MYKSKIFSRLNIISMCYIFFLWLHELLFNNVDFELVCNYVESLNLFLNQITQWIQH